MPRPNPPPPVTRPQVNAFVLGDAEKRSLACALGHERLPTDTLEAIAAAISAYKATEAGAPDTTVGNTIAALIELTHPTRRAYLRAVRRLSDDASGVDDITLAVLKPLANAVLAGEPAATESLTRAALARAAELQDHERILPRSELFRLFCGVLREIFNHTAAAAPGDAWHRCRQFALEVLTIAGIDHDFEAHPERLTEYLGTDVSG